MTKTEIAALMQRLETHYDFQCEGGPLRLCVEWQRLKATVIGSGTQAAEAERALPTRRSESA